MIALADTGRHGLGPSKEEKTPGVPGLDLPPVDVVQLARGYGCRAERAGSADEAADLFKASLGHDGPTVIAVSIDKAAPPLI